MNNKNNWLEGRVKEVARVYHEQFGLTNITYNMAQDKVEFYSDGYYFTVHKAIWKWIKNDDFLFR